MWNKLIFAYFLLNFDHVSLRESINIVKYEPNNRPIVTDEYPCLRNDELKNCLSVQDSVNTSSPEGYCQKLHLNLICYESAMKLYCSEEAAKNIRFMFYISKQLDDKHSSNCEKLKEAILHHVGGAQITVLNEMEAELAVVQFPIVYERNVTVTEEPDRGTHHYAYSAVFAFMYMVLVFVNYLNHIF
ncbi:hypothetical protein DdX_11375 [Ditylenchus destructor]|uniref:Uncharacterized protein n=1 Tax=Ditylenchus destructor TaxID=166010 RepID=A0AAD4MWY9_9BILA|nr:hypothetical protein DdX_11375 [Ditylenchus destructor]